MISPEIYIGTTTKQTERGKERFQSCLNAVRNLITDKIAIKALLNSRNKFKNENDNPQSLIFPDHLKKHLELIYKASIPIANNLSRKKIGRFQAINVDTIKDIHDSHQLILWRVIAELFRWQDYSDPSHATAALISYLEKAIGNQFASDIIKNQKLVQFSKSQRTHSISRPVEEIVIALERADEIAKIWKKWISIVPSNVALVMVDLFLNNMSLDQVASKNNISPEVAKTRLIRGKKSLFKFLKEGGLISSKDTLNGKILLDSSSRQDLLKQRRRELVKLYPKWEKILGYKPKLKKAVCAFYGLDNQKPLFDYELTAKKTGLSLTSVRVLVSEGVRLLLGQLNPSDRILEAIRMQNLLNYWKQHQKELQLTGEQKQILIMNIEQGKTLKEIASILGKSEVKVQRIRKSVLNLIETVKNSALSM